MGLFAKQPVPGQVKTRLTPPLTPEQACALYQTALSETVDRLNRLTVPLTLCYAGEMAWFRQTFPDLALLAQRGTGLAARMGHAVEELFAAGFGPVLLVGSDSPDLPTVRIVETVERLAAVDVVTVPCADGGYAVIGLRQPTTAVFAGVPWSTPRVQDVFRRRCQDLGLSYAETDGWYDLDTLPDLQELVRRTPDSRTARRIVVSLAPLL